MEFDKFKHLIYLLGNDNMLQNVKGTEKVIQVKH